MHKPVHPGPSLLSAVSPRGAPSLPEIFAISVNNPVSYHSRDSPICILQCDNPVFLCVHSSSQACTKTSHKILSKTKAAGTLLETSSRPLFSLSEKPLNFSLNKLVPHPPLYTLIMFSFPANDLISRDILVHNT